MKKQHAMLFAEFLGTFLLTGAVLMGANPFVALGILVLVIGGISGAHVNPAVSAGLALINKIKPETMYGFWAAQLVGAIAARGMYSLVSVAPIPYTMNATQTTLSVFASETIGAAIFLCGITLAVAQKLSGITLAAAVGGSLFLGAIFGGTLNPAVAIGANDLSFATLAGPLIGGAIGAWLANAYLAHFVAVKK